jgi:peptide/nickel transport system substrate-binding protein
MTTLQTVKGLSRAGTYVTELDTATAVDDLNLQVKLKQSDYRLFFKSLTFRFDLGDDVVVQAPQMYKDVAAATAGSGMLTFSVYDMAKGWPISTGPYGVGTSTDQLTNYDIRPTWWAVDTGFVAAMPDVWRLTQTLYVNDTLAAQGLIGNDYDQTLDLRPMVAAATLAQAGDHLTTWTGNKMPYGYMDWWPISIWFTTPTKPWDNPDVRWAVAYAIDQQAVVDIAWGGAGAPAIGPFPGGFAALNKYMDTIKDVTTQYNVLEFSLDKSAALMQKAGFSKDKDGFWVDASGVRPTANLQAPVPLFGDLAPVVVAQLRAAGFDSAAKAPPDMWTAVTDGRDAMSLYGHGGSTRDPYDTLFLYSKSAIVAVGTAAGSNFCRWTDPTFEADLEKMNMTSPDDATTMNALFKEMMTIYYTQLPDCPLVQWFHRILVNDTYWTNWPNQDNPYMNSALWHLTCLYLTINLKATNHA